MINLISYKYIIAFFIRSLQKNGLCECFEIKLKRALALLKKNSKKQNLNKDN